MYHKTCLSERSDAADLLLQVTTMGDRLAMVYEDNPANFLDQLKIVPNGITIFSRALEDASLSPAELIADLLTADPGNSIYQSIDASTIVDKNYFYLAEHHFYGSSRLGIKTYWPGEYLYQWDASETAAGNQALLDASALSYRAPWYSWKLNDLVNSASLEPFGHASNMPIYSQRVLGQKRYELTNHLGNVMAVVSDKITETSASANAPDVDGEPANRRASLQAAYDYYPFGMLMPNRYLEDNSQQCTPQTITWYQRVPTVVQHVDMNSEATALDGLTIAEGTAVGNTHWNAPEGENDGYIDLELLPGLDVPNGGLTVATYSISSLGANKSFRVRTHVTSTEAVPLKIEVVQTNENDEEELLCSNDVAYDAEVELEGTTLTGGNIKVRFKTTRGSTTVRIYSLAAETMDLVTGSYVRMYCNDQFGLSKDYRFGFNGQEKDNEIKGLGNSLNYTFRMHDPRLGRFFAVDPIARNFPWNSPYAFAENRVIDGVEFEGLEVVLVNPTGKDAPTYYAGMKNKDKSAIHIYAHGNPNALLGDKGFIETPQAFKKMLERKSEQWRNKKSNGETVIVLHSCRTGRDNYEGDAGKVPESFAKRMSASKEFKDVTIIAPNERDVFSAPEGRPQEAEEVGPRKAKYDKGNSDHKDGKEHKTGEEQGVWNVYRNGELIETYDGDWVPKGDPGIIDNLLHQE